MHVQTQEDLLAGSWGSDKCDAARKMRRDKMRVGEDSHDEDRDI